MNVSHNGTYLPEPGAFHFDTDEPLTGAAVNIDDTAPFEAVDRPQTFDDTGDIDLTNLNTTESAEPTADDTDFVERARQEIPSNPSTMFGERLNPWVYIMSVSLGITGQVLGFGALFGGTLWDYVAAGFVGFGFELIMVSFGDLALGMRKREHKVRQWIPFMFFSGCAAGVASGMNLLHWWGFAPSLAMIFAGVAMLGYLGHMTREFVAGTQHLKDIERQRRIRARELAEEHRAAQQARIEAAKEAERRARVEQAEREAEELRKNLPKPQRKGQKIERADAVHIGMAMGAIYPKDLGTAIATIEHPKFGGWVLPKSDTTFKNWTTEIKNRLNGTTT